MSCSVSTPDSQRSIDVSNEGPDSRNVFECERHFSCSTQYRKSHATMKWHIGDVSARDAHGERLSSAEFVVGAGANQTSWVLLCNFGTQNYEDYVSAHVKLVTKTGDVCADVELAIIGADGKKANAESKVARVFSNSEDRDITESSWGYFSFAKRADLRYNPELVPDDKLTLFGRVSVYGKDATTSTQDSEVGVATEDEHLRRLSEDMTRLFFETQPSGDDGDANADLIAVETESSRFFVHRHVLTARSAVFSSMLSLAITGHGSGEDASAATWQEIGNGKITVTDAEPEVMRLFLLYLYSGKIPNDAEDRVAEELMILADKYDVEDLKRFCEKRLDAKGEDIPEDGVSIFVTGATFTTGNVSRLLVIADRHRCSDLKRAALEFLSRNLSQVMESEDWSLVEEGHPSLVAEAFRWMALRDS